MKISCCFFYGLYFFEKCNYVTLYINHRIDLQTEKFKNPITYFWPFQLFDIADPRLEVIYLKLTV